MTAPACIECGKPARLTRALDSFDLCCSDFCGVQRFNREWAQGVVKCVGELTVEKIDQALSTTGWEVPGGGEA